ncbi:MAG: hypothetical protein GC160_26950 [Acidobacteria bacterium]|nr:hypothetical protein [Acidobacteriota bacterium]
MTVLSTAFADKNSKIVPGVNILTQSTLSILTITVLSFPAISSAQAPQGANLIHGDAWPQTAARVASGADALRQGGNRTKKASISSVVQGASFGDAISSGSWVTIFGTDLAQQTRLWRDDEIVEGQLPSALDGIRVVVNGVPASIYFISPSQINIQAPDLSALGPVTVEILQNDISQAQSTAQVAAAAPGFFMFDPEGRRYVAAVHADGTLLGPEGLFGQSLLTRPAEPGEVVLLFGTGFGPTDPSVPAGHVFSGAATLSNPVRVLIGDLVADVLFAGLTGAGLHQLNVVVPPAARSGDLSLVAETMGMSTQEGAFLTVQDGTAGLPAPAIAYFSAAPTSITAGQTTLLSWSTEHADNVQIDNGIGPVGAQGTKSVSPSATTTYNITATGPGGSKTASATIMVTQPAPTVQFSAAPNSIKSGESSTLTWSTQHADNVQIDNGIGPVNLQGTKSVSPSGTTTYNITATGPGGSKMATATVTVAPKPAPTVQFSASPSSITAGQSSTLTWSTQNVDSVQIDHGIGGVSPNGSRTVSPATSTTYQITATGPGGSKTALATVTVSPGSSGGTGQFGPCGSKTTCGEMTSCEEAKYFLNVCKVTRLDADHDGVPCESICPGG